MPSVLVLYGTTEGQTARIAQSFGATLRTHGVHADVIDAGLNPTPGGYAAVVIAASVHAGKYQRSVRKWVRHHAQELNAAPSAFISVCLAVLDKAPDAKENVTATIERFLDDTGWRPTVIKSVAGALVYTRYNPFVRWVMKRIVRKAGGDTDTSRDYDYTDWNDIRAFAGEFAHRLEGTPPHRGAAVAT